MPHFHQQTSLTFNHKQQNFVCPSVDQHQFVWSLILSFTISILFTKTHTCTQLHIYHSHRIVVFQSKNTNNRQDETIMEIRRLDPYKLNQLTDFTVADTQLNWKLPLKDHLKLIKLGRFDINHSFNDQQSHIHGSPVAYGQTGTVFKITQ